LSPTQYQRWLWIFTFTVEPSVMWLPDLDLFFMLFQYMDDMILTVMAYDLFVAICHHLCYSAIINPCLCVFLVLMFFI
jgi:hypothetical protein